MINVKRFFSGLTVPSMQLIYKADVIINIGTITMYFFKLDQKFLYKSKPNYKVCNK